jgi:hypothetical protein
VTAILANVVRLDPPHTLSEDEAAKAAEIL